MDDAAIRVRLQVLYARPGWTSAAAEFGMIPSRNVAPTRRQLAPRRSLLDGLDWLRREWRREFTPARPPFDPRVQVAAERAVRNCYMIELRAQGFTQREIALCVGLSRSQVQRILARTYDDTDIDRQTTANVLVLE